MIETRLQDAVQPGSAKTRILKDDGIEDTGCGYLDFGLWNSDFGLDKTERSEFRKSSMALMDRVCGVKTWRMMQINQGITIISDFRIPNSGF